ncbi:hypothetical protein FMEXI_13483 [Fusarium mexicanum]|uniref:CCHC-type domain-containing protein n=1 Tax=Fusarium mexicanum TaxID=751941 RepID=A0A8H5MJS5_9HYPO|nr:hypothetical protein FMEXI_13483 [Fusarium mexicanum]
MPALAGPVIGSLADDEAEPAPPYDNPAPDKYKKALKFQSKACQSAEPEPTHTFAKVAWTAGQNKLVDDAARRATEACPDKVVVRVLPWKREFANLQRVTDAKPAVTETETHSLASNVDLAMADHLDAFRARQSENSHPSCVFASLSEYARGIAQADKQTWSGVIAAWNEKKKDPDAFAMKSLCLTAVFSYQRQTSLFHRMEDAGRILARRSRNYRARVNAASWAQTMFYGGNMSIVHRNHSEASKKFHNWMEEKFKKFGCLSTTVMIRPDNAEELKTGNSYANPANANFAVQLVVQLYRDAALVDARDFSKGASVLILTPYREQKRLYELLLRQLTKAEVPKDLVEVRTDDDSPSHEADFVILDLVRTVKKGFSSEAPRMNKTPLEWPLNHLVAFLEERSAVINLRDRCRWYLMCQNCCQPGHLATECTFKPKCVRCDGASHATRNCPRAEEDEISTSASEPITADDGIQRDVLQPPRVDFSDSRRSKKNSTTREEAFAKPDKHKDAMRKAFRNAMRGLREVKKDQGVKEDVDTDEQGQAGGDETGDDGTADGSADDGVW